MACCVLKVLMGFETVESVWASGPELRKFVTLVPTYGCRLGAEGSGLGEGLNAYCCVLCTANVLQGV